MRACTDRARKRRSPRRGSVRRRCDQGVSLVEFALLLPVFLMLLLGLISGGLALNEKQQMTHALREGARYGSTVASTQTFSTGTWASNVRDVLLERSTGTLTAAQVCVSLVRGSGAGITVVHSTNGGLPCIPLQPYPVTIDDGLRVQVTASKPDEIQLGLFGAYAITLSGEATVRSEAG